jgi:hypothetical protein
MHRKISFAISLLVLLTASIAHAEDDDVVFLKNGGRVRGTVVFEDPQEGVQIRLSTGVVRSIARADLDRVQYGGPEDEPAKPSAVTTRGGPRSGSIHVESTVPGRVFLDGGLVGPTPADVASTMPGVHVVRVEFDQGGSQEERILVQAGQPASVTLDLPKSAVGFAARSGVHLGVGVEGTLIVFPSLSGGGHLFASAGGTGQLVINIALAPVVDLRATAFAGVTQGDFTFTPIGASFGARFNVGSFYTASAGFRGGVAIAAGSNGGTVIPMFGPEVSPVGFRFGDQREFSLELTERIGLYDSSGFISVTTEHAIGLQYLFL